MILALYKVIFGISVLTILVSYGSVYYSNKQSVQSPSRAISNVEVNDSYFVVLGWNQSRLKRYLHSLSPLQATDVIRQMGANNLVSKLSQEQFLNCPIKKLSQQLNSRRIPPSHQNCKKMSFQISGPIVALGSIPGSGNSWVRQLLESATGIYTGSIYCDKSYVKAGMFGEGVTTENVIAIKTHKWPYAIKNLSKAIYIVRSPFGFILSEHNRYLAKVHKLGNSHTMEVDSKYYNYGMETS